MKRRVYADVDRGNIIAAYGAEINAIGNTKIKCWLVDTLEMLPEAYWYIPASRGHHPVDERGLSGGLIHAKRTARVAIDLCRSFDMPAYDRDIVIAAALLHDGMNCVQVQRSPYSCTHDELMDQWIDTVTHTIFDDAIVRVCEYIRIHMGPWGWHHREWYNETCYSMVLNIADYIASREWAIGIDIWSPINV